MLLHKLKRWELIKLYWPAANGWICCAGAWSLLFFFFFLQEMCKWEAEEVYYNIKWKVIRCSGEEGRSSLRSEGRWKPLNHCPTSKCRLFFFSVLNQTLSEKLCKFVKLWSFSANVADYIVKCWRLRITLCCHGCHLCSVLHVSLVVCLYLAQTYVYCLAEIMTRGWNV